MPYQNVGSPRFYINMHEYLYRAGYTSNNYGDDLEILMTLPVYSDPIGKTANTAYSTAGTMSLGKNFLAGLNMHNSNGFKVNDTDLSIILGGDGIDGVRIGTFDFDPLDSAKIKGKAGSLILGFYYDLDAPDVSLSMERKSADNVKETTSYLGSSFSNTYSMPNYWGYKGRWEATEGFGSNRSNRIGNTTRRVWNLSWSFLEDRDILGVNQLYSPILNSGGDTTSGYSSSDISSGQFAVGTTNDDTFYNQVLKSSFFGQIPFIFQPNYNSSDSANEGGNAPDQFAICKIRDKSIKVTKTTPELSNISLTLEEVW
jgi:hypothetical protein